MPIIRTVICMLCLCVAAHPQLEHPEDRFQVRGVAGWAGFGDEGLIHHDVLGVMTDVRLAGGLRIGPEVLYNIGPGRDRDFSIMPVVGYDFRRLKRFTPFVNGGFGLLLHTDGSRWSNSFAYGAGGGVKIAISERFFIAPEVRAGWEPVARAMISLDTGSLDETISVAAWSEG